MSQNDDPLVNFEIHIDPTAIAFTTLARLLAMMRLSAYILSIFGIVIGILILLGGDLRFSGIAYTTAMLVYGAPQIWGWTMLIFAIVGFAGVKNRMYRVGMWGMGLCGVWCMLFALAFFISAIQYENANLTAIAAYTALGTLFLLSATAQRVLSQTTLGGADQSA